jgi:aspartyl-tRNA(Asn)/glutamyl-tRNA(Gln) amidotransferase subunit B
MEIVTDPVFREADEVMEFLKELQKMFRASGVSDADMEKGQMRCDVNLSIMPVGSTTFGTRTEMKNLNTFSGIGRAIEHEFKRQVKILDEGGQVDQETRGWDDEKGTSTTQRSKEDAMDYRYFPEPDLLPIVLDDDFIAECRASLPELPIEKRLKYLNDFKL